MSGFSTYWADAILNEILRGVDVSTLTNVYISLHTADPGDAGASEVTGNAYARVAVATATGWNAPGAGGGGRLSDNVAVIQFPTATPAGWGSVTHVGIWDAATVGNFLYGGALTIPRTVGSGDAPKFNAGELDVIHNTN